MKWIIEHQLTFVNALLFVMMDLTDEVSAGTVDSAKEILEKLIRQCNSQHEQVCELSFPTILIWIYLDISIVITAITHDRYICLRVI